MDLEDKIILSKDLVCPPHCLFHKLRFTKPVTKGPCNYRNKKWGAFHHIHFAST